MALPKGGMRMLSRLDLNNATFGENHSLKNRTSICTHPYRIYSLGAWRPHRGPLEYSIPLLATQITVIVSITQGFNFIFRPLSLPPIFSQILGGILLGDELVGKLLTRLIYSISYSPVGKMFGNRYDELPDSSDYLQKLFPLRGSGPLGNLATIGFMLFQFLLGVKMDPGMISNSGIKAAAIGISSFICPLVVGVCTVPILMKIFKVEAYMQTNHAHVEHMFYYIAAAQSMSTFPVIATLLTELKILNSDLGRLALSSSMVGEACNLLLTLVLIHFKKFDASSWTQLKFPTEAPLWGASPGKESYCKDRVWLCAPVAAATCVGFVVFMVRPAIKCVIKRSPKDKPMKEVYVMTFLAAVLLSGFISTAIGNHVLFGPFILGLAVPDGPPLGTTLVSKFEPLTICLLLPLFITISGLRTMLISLQDLSFTQLLIMPILVLVTTMGKIVATMFPCLYFRMPFRDALALGIILSAKGIVELSTYNVWRDAQVLNDATFTYIILLVATNAAIVPYLVRALYDPAKKYASYVRRTILHSKAGVEFKVLACINETENVPTFIKLLHASNSTIESPIYAYVLHLIELVGRDAPLFISHDDKTRAVDTFDSSQSEHIIKAFRNYEQQNQSTVNVQAFTSISPFSTMHDDICTLALDNCTVLAILPFHKQWSVGGTMDALGKNSLRALNQKVLSSAPCSVGILVDRGKNKATNSMRVGVPFLGGADDREALAYAKRMSHNPNVSITVIRLVAAEGILVNEFDIMLDKEVLRDFKLSTKSNERVVYREEVVGDGGQTAWMIHSMEKDHDLLIVGRHHGFQAPILSGITEWTECPELGEVGDMLALSEVKAEVSVLVIQQMTVPS